MTVDEIGTLAEQCDVSRGRVLIWEKEGRKLCTICGGPVLSASYGQPTHVDFRVKTHEAKT